LLILTRIECVALPYPTYAIARPSVCRLSVCRQLQRACALLRRFKFSAIFLWL